MWKSLVVERWLSSTWPHLLPLQRPRPLMMRCGPARLGTASRSSARGGAQFPGSANQIPQCIRVSTTDTQIHTHGARRTSITVACLRTWPSSSLHRARIARSSADNATSPLSSPSNPAAAASLDAVDNPTPNARRSSLRSDSFSVCIAAKAAAVAESTLPGDDEEAPVLTVVVVVVVAWLVATPDDEAPAWACALLTAAPEAASNPRPLRAARCKPSAARRMSEAPTHHWASHGAHRATRTRMQGPGWRGGAELLAQVAGFGADLALGQRRTCLVVSCFGHDALHGRQAGREL